MRSSSDMATRFRACSKRLGSRRRSAFPRTIIPKSLPCWLAMHRSCSGCIIRFDKDAKNLFAENFFLLLAPDPGGQSRLHIERRQPNYPFLSFALGFFARAREVFC